MNLENIFIKKLENKTEYYYNGKLHREDGPAVEYVNGTKLWYQNGQYHRLDGPACEFTNGDKFWYQNNKRHRLDGPAIEFISGVKYWYQNGQCHRLDGPAYEHENGTKRWYIEGKEYTEKEYNKKIGKKMNKENIVTTLQDRIEKATYRSAGRNITKGIAKGIIVMLKDKGTDESTLSIISAFFETEFGESLIGMLLGIAIPQIPMINEDERALILAEEFQVESTSRVMDTIISEVAVYIMPVISGVIEKIPSKKIRILKEDNKIEENDEKEEEEIVIKNDKISTHECKI
jgi:hypothetical protein